MARRRYRRKKGLAWEELVEDAGWIPHPETAREILAIVFLILGAIGALGIFGLAGRLGQSFLNLFQLFWGVIGFLAPFVLLLYSLILLAPKRFKVTGSMAIGTILLFIFLPALVGPAYGGVVGAAVFNLADSFIGPVAAFIALLGLTLAAILLTFNTNFRALWEKMRPSGEPGVKVHEAGVSVFTTLSQKMGLGAKKDVGPVPPPTKELPTVSSENWQFPSLELLEVSTSKATPGNITKNVEIIQKTLRDFGIDVSMADVNIGPTVTQYTLKPSEGVKLNQILARTNDLALALASHPIRVEAPIPGKSAVGIEVPNKQTALVTIREILESTEFKTIKSQLAISLGRDVAGIPVSVDLERMPHLLIAGATGSGKSICIHSIIAALLYQNSPADLRLILVDPKRVEFTHYNGIPHLLTPVITDADKTINVLKWAIAEMERRFRLFQETHRRDISAYNASPPDGKIPYIVVVIDELADLMAQAANEVEGVIVRLAQMARATGIHLVVATQRPSVDVITGLIKANITSRIAFAVASQVDSRTILDLSGAERLLGSGDMLYLGSDLGKPKRVQGSFITDKEVKAVTDFLKREGAAVYDESIASFRPPSERLSGELLPEDDLYREAMEVVVAAGKASASLLQRRLRVGYARAARLLDLLEQEGIIGPADGAKPRDILISPESLARRAQTPASVSPSSPSAPTPTPPPVSPSVELDSEGVDSRE